jgi:hypothetical protein
MNARTITFSARTITFSFCIAVLPALGLAQQDRPSLKESPTNLVAVIDSTARANFEVACLNVTRDAAQKKLRIYAVTSEAQTGTVREGDFEIEVIYHRELAAEDKRAAGAYHQHNNHLVLRFAAAQFAAGKKALGLRLVRLLAEADPEMSWSIPTHQPLTIQKILAGLEKDDEMVKAFLREESEDWAYRLKNYTR